MAKYKVKTAAIFDGKPAGSTIELDESLAKKYEALKYVEIISEVESSPVKKASAPKKPTKKASAKSKEPTEKSTEK